jgi:tRNA (cmo5U34)-methyltransferase
MTEPRPVSWGVSDTELFARFADAFVPRRREQLAVVCELLTAMPSFEVLDLGCGEGLLSLEVLRRFPEARVTALDASSEMLELAARTLTDFGDRVRLVQAKLEDILWREGRFGAIITSLAVHHLDGPAKQKLYADLHRMLVPSGVFVMIDLLQPATLTTRRLAACWWDQEVKRASHELYGGPEAFEAFRDSEWNYFLLSEPDPVDKPSRLVEHVDWLRDAGFVDVDVSWVVAGHAVIVATRPGANAEAQP